jgi:hypothetical protein
MKLYCWNNVKPFLGVPGYRPQFLVAPDDIGEEDRARLSALRGQRLVRSWAVWEEWTLQERNGRVRRKVSGWNVDGPLILEFETDRLELAAWQDATCLSWDMIDIAQGVHWGDEDDDRRTWWHAVSRDELGRHHALKPLTALRDPLGQVLVVEWYEALGFGFRAGTALALVFNAFDELGLSDKPGSPPDVRLTPI